MPEIQLRPYQKEAVEEVFKAWDRGVHTPTVVLPTGSGKSVTMAEIVRQLHEKNSDEKILVLAHRSELLKQLKKAVHQLDDSITVGTVKAQTREYESDVIVASVQTLSASVNHLVAIGKIQAVIVDEAHHYAAETYKRVLENLGSFDRDDWTPTVGFTATLWRSDGGLEKVWKETVYSKDLKWAIDEGFLVKPRGLVVVTKTIDLSKVRVVAGDYVKDELEQAMMSSVESTVTAMDTHCRDRACIVFAAGVNHAYALADSLTEAGMPAGLVVGSMSDDERREVYDAFNSGRLHSMVTVTVLTEGADFPRCDCVVMARPTQSKSLHSQQVGRALRLYTDPVTGVEKKDALVLDLAGHTRRMSLVDLSKLDDSFEVDFVDPLGFEVDEPEPEEESGGARPKPQRRGVLEVEEVDLFDPNNGKRTPRWLKTYGGTMFLPGESFVTFLREGAGNTWYVGWITARGMVEGNWVSSHNDIASAMASAESFARSRGDLPLRSKNQFKNIAPTEKQVNYARILGITDPEQFTKARLQDEISSALASRRLDAGR